MYLQITSVCNMSCAHCCMSCAANKRGEYMTMETFNNAVRLFDTEYFTIGGGEPTLHPKLFEMIGTILCLPDASLFMVTNGKKTNVAKALFGLSNGNDRFEVELSQDEYHDPIDPSVVQMYRSRGSIRTVTRISNTGHAALNGVSTTDDCSCPDLLVKPNGDVMSCSCDDAIKLFNVNNADAPQRYREYCNMFMDLDCSQCTSSIIQAIDETDLDDLSDEAREMANWFYAQHEEQPEPDEIDIRQIA